MSTGLKLAIKKLGTTGDLAKSLGITREAIYQWRDIPVAPVNRVLQIEKLTGIPRERLRPDIYPKREK